jgi:dTDP-4-dehydrorhamnose reductase
MKKKLFIAGAGGMLGDAFYKVFNKDYILQCTDIDVNSSWLEYLDFRNKEQYFKMVQSFKPDYLFHVGAYTDLEYCELHEQDTYDTNTLSVKYAVEIANELNIPLLYISTAGIFDGSKEVYDEDDLPNPLSVYAKTKYDAELFVQKNIEKHLICRAGWMMGGGITKDKKFIKKIINQLVQKKNILHVVDDKDGTPTYTIDFALNVKLLIESNQFGLYNMVCNGVTSRYEVAMELISLLELKDKVTIVPVSSDYFKQDYFATRPISERLINKRLNQIEMNIMRDWKIALREYINEYYSDLKF